MKNNKGYNIYDTSDKHLDKMISKLVNKEPPYTFRVKEQKAKKRYFMLRKRFIKYTVTGLCVAAVLSAGILYGHINNLFGDKGNTSTTKQQAKNSFIMTVNAAEITKKDTPAISVTNGSSDGVWTLGYDDTITPNSKTYCAPFNIDIKGKNIDTVTYSIKNAAFDLSYRTGNSAFISGTEDTIVSSSQYFEGAPTPKEFLNELRNANTLEDVEKVCVLNKLYSSFTYDYSKEKQEKIYVYVTGNSRFLSKENQEMVNSCDEHLLTKHTPQQVKPVYDGLVNSVEIKCTVKFKDGTTQTKTIKAAAKILTQKEAYKGSNVTIEDKYKNEKDVFITFAVK